MDSKTEINVKGKTIELLKSLPLTLGDWEKLSKVEIMDGAKITVAGAQRTIDFIYILAQKQDKEVTREDIETIPLGDIPHIHEVIEKVLVEDKKTGTDPSQ